MGFKPRPVPPPPPSPGKTKRGFVDKKVVSSPALNAKSNSWWNLNETEENNAKNGGRRNSRSVRSSKSKGSNTVSQSPSTRSRKSLASTRTSSTRTPQPPPTTPVNSTRKILFRHKVFCKGQVLYEWEQNPKFVTIYYPTPNADFKAFCNIAKGHVQLGTKPKGLPTRWFLSHDTGGQVDTEDSSWKQCKHHCRIVLKKENKGSTWARALKDDRIDQTTTMKRSRAKLEKAESEPILSPEGSKKKWKNPRRRSAVNQSDDENDGDFDEDSDIESDEVDDKPKTEEDPMRRRSNSQGANQRRRSDSQSPKQQHRRSSSQGRRTRSSSQPKRRSTSQPKRRSVSQPKRRSSSQPKRRSVSQAKRPSGAGPIQRTSSAHSAGSKPMSTIFVEKESPVTPKRRSSTQARRSSRKAAPPCRRMSSRSCDSIDEDLPLQNIEVDMNSDLISVL